MGFFDLYCAESGLPLRGDTRLVLLAEETGGRWSPIALPLCGEYDRVGAIDFPSSLDERSASVDAFLRRLEFGFPPGRTGLGERLRAAAPFLKDGAWKGGAWLGPPRRVVGYTLLDAGIYSAIADVVGEARKREWEWAAYGVLEERPFEEVFTRAFRLVDLAREVCSELTEARKKAMRKPLLELARVVAWGTTFAPVDFDAGGQFDGYYVDGPPERSVAPFVRAAREKYAAHPVVLRAVDANARRWNKGDVD